MPSSTISVCNEPDDFQAALWQDSANIFLVTAGDRFRASATRIVLHHLSMTYAREHVPRVAFIALPPDEVRVSVPIGHYGLVYGGVTVRAGDIVTHRGAAHERLTGPGGWRDIVISRRFLDRYGGALIGGPVVVPAGVCVLKPPASALRRLVALHSAATRLASLQSGSAVDDESARGMEQELIMALVACLSGGVTTDGPGAGSMQGEVARRFEELIDQRLVRSPTMAEISASLGVADGALRTICDRHIGMTPYRYIRLRRMQAARRALRSTGPVAVSVAEVANHFGFIGVGRFSNSYRALFGETPAVTLRRSMGH